MCRLILAACSALTLLAAAGPAAAWGEVGHRVIAEIAERRLTPEARRQVELLLAVDAAEGEPSCPMTSLADAAAFPDCVDGIRRFNFLRRLHTDDAPLCGVPDKIGYCRNGECASEAVKRAILVLLDPLAPPGARLMALAQAAHFIGDMHQPFNMADNRDDAGAGIRVALPGAPADRRLNLNQVWNEMLVAVAAGSGELGADFLEPLAADNETFWSQGEVDGWAAESHLLARALYSRLPEPPECGRRPRNVEALDAAYVASGVNTVREQLAKAGVRLAHVLNATLR